MSATGIGASVKRKEDFRFLTGRGTYTDDINRPGQTYGYILRSPHAHAEIAKIDLSAAKSAPGVVAILGNTRLFVETDAPTAALARFGSAEVRLQRSLGLTGADPKRGDQRRVRVVTRPGFEQLGGGAVQSVPTIRLHLREELFDQGAAVEEPPPLFAVSEPGRGGFFRGRARGGGIESRERGGVRVPYAFPQDGDALEPGLRVR